MRAITAHVGGVIIASAMLALTAIFTSSAAFAAFTQSPSIYLTPLSKSWSKDGKSIIIRAQAKASVKRTYELPSPMTAVLVVERNDGAGKSYRAPIHLKGNKTEQIGIVSIAVDGDHLTAAPKGDIWIASVFSWKSSEKPSACYGAGLQKDVNCETKIKTHTARSMMNVKVPDGRPEVKRDEPKAQASVGGAGAEGLPSAPRLTLSNFRATASVARFTATLDQVASRLKTDEVLVHRGNQYSLRRVSGPAERLHRYVADVVVVLDTIGGLTQEIVLKTHRQAWMGVKATFNKYGIGPASAPTPAVGVEEEPMAGIDLGIPNDPMAMGTMEGGDAGIDNNVIYGKIKYTAFRVRGKDKMRVLVELSPDAVSDREVNLKVTPSHSGMIISVGADDMAFSQDRKWNVVEVSYRGFLSDDVAGKLTLSIDKDDADVYIAEDVVVDLRGYMAANDAMPFCHSSDNGECLHADQIAVGIQMTDRSSIYIDTTRAYTNNREWITAIGSSKHPTTLTFTCHAKAGDYCGNISRTEAAAKAMNDIRGYHHLWKLGVYCGSVNVLSSSDIFKRYESSTGIPSGEEIIVTMNGSNGIYQKSCFGISNAPFTIRAVTTRKATETP